jgi:adenylate kinase family enzyme
VQRVAIIGIAGSGKSTLAVQLGLLLDLPVIHLDHVHWKPGWVQSSPEEQAAAQRELVRGEHWIIEGNYESTVPIRLERADTVIYLDVPRTIALWRATRRGFRDRGRLRPDLGEGCPEQLMSREFASWIWNYPKRGRPEALMLLADARARGLSVFHLRSNRDVACFLEEIRSSSGTEARSRVA